MESSEVKQPLKVSDVLQEMQDVIVECRKTLELLGRPYDEAALVHLMTQVVILRRIDTLSGRFDQLLKALTELGSEMRRAIDLAKGTPV